MDGEHTVRHNPERQRYELSLGDKIIGFAEAVPQGETVRLPYVFVEPEYRGQHFAAELMRETLEDLRSQGRKVTPICPYVVAYIRRNPQYAEMVAGPVISNQ